mmetsp:Transcript_15794/g.28723  ORF Transcript_15794/g.28723 Transcript_15794/m.28723 type:complete len:474 (-) Transcript_15794:232-1653(-)
MKNLFCTSSILLGILVAATNQSGASAAECVQRLSEIIIATGKAIANDPSDVSEVMTFHLCPNTTYELNYPEGNQYISLVRPNVHILCGEDGSSANNCILDAENSNVHVVSNFYDKPPEDQVIYILENIVISGMTFTGNSMQASIYVSVPGEVTFYDCIWRDITDASALLILWRDPSAAWYGEVVSDSPTTPPPTVTAQTSPTELPTGTPPPTVARHPKEAPVPLDANRDLQETDQTFNDPIFVNVERCTFENNSPDESYFYVDASEEVSIYDYDTGGFTYMYPSEFGECALSIIDSTITAGGEKPKAIFEAIRRAEIYVQNSCITNVPSQFGFIWRDREDQDYETEVKLEGSFVRNSPGDLCDGEFVSVDAAVEGYDYETGDINPDTFAWQCEPNSFASLERCPLLPLPPTGAPSKATVTPNPTVSPSNDNTVALDRGTTTAPTTTTSAGRMVRVQTVFVTAAIGVIAFANQL